jgi:hypothetical protein
MFDIIKRLFYYCFVVLMNDNKTGVNMKLFYFNYHANCETQAGEFYASSRERVQEMILRVHPHATAIHIWLA